MSHDRFYEIRKYLHLVDNVTLPKQDETGYSKLGKVQPVIDSVNKQCQTMYNVGREVSVDEAMIPFKGRLAIKQYMQNKPVKRGIKVRAMADANNGYVVYTDRKWNEIEKGLGSRVRVSS